MTVGPPFLKPPTPRTKKPDSRVLQFLKDLSDPYERRARLFPGLLVALPVIVPLVCTFGAKNATLTGVIALLSTCGVSYALASIARGRGKALEERLVAKWGGLPTTLILRHRDPFFDSITKQRYHADIKSKLGIDVPTADQELAEPNKADEAYMAAGRQLRERTRGNKSLLLKENIAYGFHRNMLGMKIPGVLSALFGVFYGLVLADALALNPLAVDLSRLAYPGLAAGLTLAISLVLLLAWLSYFNEDKMRRMGYAYAERLLEQLGALPKKTASRAKKIDEA